MTNTVIDPGEVRHREVQRLTEQLDDNRDATAAIALALEAFKAFDPRQHRLTRRPRDERLPNEMSHPEFFREVALDRFMACRNVGSAGRLLDRLISDGQR